MRDCLILLSVINRISQNYDENKCMDSDHQCRMDAFLMYIGKAGNIAHGR